jgi:hypothetical protein
MLSNISIYLKIEVIVSFKIFQDMKIGQVISAAGGGIDLE